MSKDIIPNFSEEEKIAWLRLIRTPRIGRNTFFSLINQFGTAQKVIDGLDEYTGKLGLKEKFKVCSKEVILDEIKKCEKLGAKIITFPEDEYPNRLREIQDPPVAITVRGNIDILKKDIIGIVGSRNGSTNACRFTHLVAEELGDSGIIVVSGMARGIDTQAHKGSLDHGTIAVIAGGVDNIYPRENEQLYYDIIKKGGAIISEMPLGSVPKASNFPQRNRIISGLTWGLVVVEASLRSGTLITAKFALEQGKEVFALPGSPFDERSKGCNKLIKDGATLIESPKDILSEIQYMIAEKEYMFREEELKSDGKSKESSIFAEFNRSELEEEYIDRIRGMILALINTTPTPIDNIIRQTGFSAQIINIALMQLELMGKVEVRYGKVERLYTDEELRNDVCDDLFGGDGVLF